MVEKRIRSMGKIIFDNFYNEKNLKIKNVNLSPIRMSKKINKLTQKEVENLIDNEYIFSLLKKRKNYIVYECDPINLVSQYRYDVFVKYFYVESYINNKNLELAKKIYLNHIKAFNNFSEPDGKKNTSKEFLNAFNSLISSILINGFKDSIIPISKTGIPIDGAHRLAISLYLKNKVNFVVFNLLDGKYDRDFFESRGFDKEYLKIIDKIYFKIVGGSK